LIITCGIETRLDPPVEGTRAPSLSFRHGDREVVGISQAVAIDADGRRLSLDLAYADGRMELRVPAEWIAEAVFPLVVDPLVGGLITLDSSVRNTRGYPCSVAYNPNANQWFVAWNEQFGTAAYTFDVFAQRLDANGALVGSTITVSATASIDDSPVVSYAASVNRYLVAFDYDTSGRGTGPTYVYGRIYNADGTAFSSSFLIDSRGAFMTSVPHAAFDGTNWFIAYTHVTLSADQLTSYYNVYGRFLSTAGVPGTAVVFDSDADYAALPRVASTNGSYLVTWKKSGLTAGSLYNLVACTMSGTGVLGPRVTIEAANGVGGHSVSARPGQYLLAWPVLGTSTKSLHARLISPALGFDSARLTVATVNTSNMTTESAWSATTSRWALFHSDPNGAGDLYAVPVTTTGTMSAPERLTTTGRGATAPSAAWNSATNTFLVAYQGGAVTPYQILALMYSLPSASPTPPAAPVINAAAGNAQVVVSWNAVSGTTGYVLYRALGAGAPFEPIGFPSTTTFTDAPATNGVLHRYTVVATGPSGTSGYSNEASATPAAPIPLALMVVGSTTLGAGDSAAKVRLEGLGYSVAVISGSAATSASANGKAVVLVSSTVASTDVNTKFRSSSVPVVVWENALFDDFGMTGLVNGTDFGTLAAQTSVSILVPTHPLAAGLSGTVPVSTTSGPITWGVPNANAAKVASVAGGSARPTVFGYDHGSSMPGLAAPARRVGLFLGDATASTFTAQGGKLFDAAVRWAAGTITGPATVVLIPGNGKVEVRWEPVAGALSYTVQRASSSGGPWTTVASGLTGTSFTSTGLTNGTTYFFRVLVQTAGGLGEPSLVLQGRPAATVLQVAVTGRPYLRTFPPGGLDPQLWGRGTYTAQAKRIAVVNGVEVAQDAGAFSTSWQLLGGGGSVTTSGLSSNPLTLTATSNPGTVKIRVTVTSGADTASSDFTVKVSERHQVSVWFRFPEDAVGQRTARVPRNYTNNDLWAFSPTNDPAVEDRRRGARYNVMSPFIQPNVDILKQAGIDLYFLLDVNLGMKIGEGFDAGGYFVIDFKDVEKTDTVDRIFYPRSPAFTKIATTLNEYPYINVYLVKNLRSLQNGTLLGVTYYGSDVDASKRTILLADSVSESNANLDTLAHEVLHVFLEGHIVTDAKIEGTLNNLSSILRPANQAPKHLLMFTSDTVNSLIPGPQADRVRSRLLEYKTKQILSVGSD
jgi:hypothetical protein